MDAVFFYVNFKRSEGNIEKLPARQNDVCAGGVWEWRVRNTTLNEMLTISYIALIMICMYLAVYSDFRHGFEFQARNGCWENVAKRWPSSLDVRAK